MAENIASRVGRLISGTANMLVDSVENMAPEVVMEEAIREVGRAIDDVRAELGKVLSKQHMAMRRLAEENRKHGEISEKVEVALKEGREDLAESAVSQILDIEAQIPVLEATVGETKEAETELEGYITALQARKREMQDDLRQFRDAVAAGAAPGEPEADRKGPGAVETSIRKAEEAFDRAIEGAGGIAGSKSPPSKLDAAKRAELDDLVRQNRIKERLETFKSKDD